MALCRCKESHGNPKGKREYVNCIEPLGYPKCSSICGRKGCENPGMIWLTKEEWKNYNNGQRIFHYASAVTKVMVK